MEYSRRPTKSIPKENQLKILNKIYQTYLVSTTPLTKASDAELWYFLWSVPWINGWVNNREAGDMRDHRAHYNVIVMANVFSVNATEPRRSRYWFKYWLSGATRQQAIDWTNVDPGSMPPYGVTIPQRVKFQYRPWVCWKPLHLKKP